MATINFQNLKKVNINNKGSIKIIKKVDVLRSNGVRTTVWVEENKTATPSISVYNTTPVSIEISVRNNDSSSATIYVSRDGISNYINKGVVSPGSTVRHNFTGLYPETTYGLSAYAVAGGKEQSGKTSIAGRTKDNPFGF